MGEEAQIEEMAVTLGIETVPSTWREHWAGYHSQSAELPCVRAWSIPDNAATVFGLPAEVLPVLNEVCNSITRNRKLAHLAGLWHHIIFHVTTGITECPNGWPTPAVLGELAPLFPLAILVSGTDHALQAFRRMGIPVDITQATLAFGGIYVGDYRRKHGVWGLGELGWFMNHVHARLFRLGRLVFKRVVYQWPFRAYRHKTTGQVLTICENRGLYRDDGLANGTNGSTSPDAWTPTLEIGADVVRGYPVSADGLAIRRPVELRVSDWELALVPGHAVIETHIPGGEKLLPVDCIAAYRQALDFFPRYYPADLFKAFTCKSWLMDPGLSRILPSTPNIVQFQKPFHQLPVAGSELQAYNIVFGSTSIDLQTAPRTTALQRAIVDYVAGGNQLRSSAGYMTLAEVTALVRQEAEQTF